MVHLLCRANVPSAPVYTSSFLQYPQVKYLCVETDSLVELHLVLFFLLPYSKTTASPALLCRPLSLAIWCGPELCFRRMFQHCCEIFLFIMSCKSFQSIRKKIHHYTNVSRNLFFGKKCSLGCVVCVTLAGFSQYCLTVS